jgi:hypothetical protein
MALRFPNQGEQIALKLILNADTPQNLVLRLFKSYTGGDIELYTESSFTEANFTGYAPVTLTGSNWTFSGGNPSVASYPLVTFQSTADQTPQVIYGYYATQATSGKLVFYEFFTSPVNVMNNGDTIKIALKVGAE